MTRALSLLLLAAGGTIVALVTAAAHRSAPPWGAVMCIVLVAAGAVFARSWHGWPGIAAFGLPWAGVTYAFSLVGPGGSVLIAQDVWGYALALGGGGAVVLVCLVPRSWLVGRRDVAT